MHTRDDHPRPGGARDHQRRSDASTGATSATGLLIAARRPRPGPCTCCPASGSARASGWTSIALPFAKADGQPLDYRLLLNQFDEELNFTLVLDKAVPNRGVDNTQPAGQTDQFTVTLDYEQVIHQVAVEDRPESEVGARPASRSTTSPGCS